MEAATAEKTTTFHPPSPKSKLPVDVLIHQPTPVDEFRSPTKAIDVWAPSAGNLDPRSHHHPDNNSSLSSPLTRDWNRSNNTADLLTPTHSTSPFQRDVKFVPPLPGDPGYSDNQPLNPPLPPVPYPYNGLAGFETSVNHANVHAIFLAQDRGGLPGQDYGSSRYDNHRERLDKNKQQHFSGHGRGDHHRGKRDNAWEPRHNGQQRWESGWSRTPYASNSNGRKKHQDHCSETTSSVGSYHDLEDRETCGDSWDGHRYDGGPTRTFDQATGHGEATQFPAANLETPAFVEPEEEEERAKPPQSLESRIQAMLQGSLPFMQLQTEDAVGSPRPPDTCEGATKQSLVSSTPHDNSCTTPPPLPPPEWEPPPPLPPLPMEDDPPPLPPEPASKNLTDGLFPSGENSASDNLEYGADIGFDTTVDSGTNGVTFSVGNEDDDDRMSLSSLSSGGEKLEVIELNVEVPGCSVPWMMNPMMQNNFRNNELNQQMLFCSGSNTGGLMMNFLHAQEEERTEEPEFQMVLDEVISELKLIMGKDMRKKMVESTAFKSFESWWLTSEAQEKVFSYSVFPLLVLHMHTLIYIPICIHQVHKYICVHT